MPTNYPRLMKNETRERNFLARTEPEPNSGCWIWIGSRGPDGYGRMMVHGRITIVSRWAYQHFIGPLGPGLEADHKCRLRSCVNPQHLEAVTHRTNCLRSMNRAAINAAKKCCKRGHPFTPENTYLMLEGGRRCRMCQRVANLRWSHKKHALGGAAV